jgi:hypothetical protein
MAKIELIENFVNTKVSEIYGCNHYKWQTKFLKNNIKKVGFGIKIKYNNI